MNILHTGFSKMNKIRYILIAFLTFGFFRFLHPLQAQGWQFKAPIPTARMGACSVVFEDKIYVFGGETATGKIVNTVEVYDPAINQWDTSFPALRTPRENCAAILYKDKIFVLGGFSDQGEVLKKVEFFNSEKNRWESFPNMDEERQGLASVVLNNVLFAIGGSDKENKLLKKVEFFNENQNKWEEFEDWELDKERASFVSLTVNDSAFSIGGFSIGGPTNRVQRYHPNTGPAQRKSLQVGRGSFAGAVCQDTIFVMGGRSPQDEVLNLVEYYTPRTNQWQFTNSMNIAREGFVAQVVKHKIYVIGGRDAQGNILSSVEEFNIDLITAVKETPQSLIPTEFILHQNFPNPFNPETQIRFNLSTSTSKDRVTLRIYNLKGQLIRTLIDDFLPAGEYEVTWDGKDFKGQKVPSGLYLYTLKQGAKSQTKKMMLIK